MARTHPDHTTGVRNATLGVAAALALFAGSANAQTFQRFNGTGLTEKAWDIESLEDGGYVTAGERTGIFGIPGGPPDVADMLVTRYDATGKPVWATQVGGFMRDVAYSVDRTMDGGFIVAGMTESVGTTLGLSLTKLGPGGTVAWSFAYPGDVFGELTNPAPDGTPPQVAVRESESGDIIAITNFANTVGGQAGVYVRTTPTGAPIVQASYIDPALELRSRVSFADLKELPGGDILITGFYELPDGNPFGVPADADILTMRLTPSGAPVWAFANGEPIGMAMEAGYGIDIDPAGERFVVGAATDKGGATLATAHLWFDSAGALLFNNDVTGTAPAYSATRYNDAADVATAGQNFFLPGAGMHGTAAGVSFDAGGAPLWLYTYGPNVIPRDRAAAVAPTDAAGVCGWIFAGWERYPLAPGAEDQHLIKVNDFGMSGCCEDERPLDPDVPFIEQRPLQIQQIPHQVFEPWGAWEPIDLIDVVKCQSPDCTPCPADLNGDGALNVDDIDAFVAAFLAGEALADLVCDGVLNVDDIDAFIAAFLAGC
ncbi:MAG: GC-type dockerin domain-anchored protein [Phycisphaerales bacterium]